MSDYITKICDTESLTNIRLKPLFSKLPCPCSSLPKEILCILQPNVNGPGLTQFSKPSSFGRAPQLSDEIHYKLHDAAILQIICEIPPNHRLPSSNYRQIVSFFENFCIDSARSSH